MRIIVVILILFLSLSKGIAQKYSFHNYSTNEGLSQSQVYDIKQDDNGYLWIATEGGLNRFDGDEFKIYTTEDGFLKDAFRTIFIDKNKIYVGSKGGLSILENEIIKVVKFDEKFSHFRVSCIAFFNDTLFVGTNGASIFYRKDDKLLPYPFFKPKNLKIRSLFPNKNQFLITSNTGLHVRFKSGSSRTILENVSFGKIKEHNSIIYIGSYKEGVYKYIDDKLKRINLIQSPEVIRDFQVNGDYIYCITKSSLKKYNIKEEKMSFEMSEPNGLPNAQLITTFIDRENNFWLGTDGKGVARFIGETFVSYSTNEGLGSNQIMYINKQDSIFYFGSYNNGLTIWEKDKKPQIINEKNGLPNNTVWTMHIESKDKFFVGTQKGLAIFDHGKIKTFFAKDGLNSDKITSICKIDEDEYLIGGPKGVNLYKEGVFYPDFYGQNLNTWIRSIKKDAQNRIWFATLTGVHYYQNNTLHKIDHDFDFQEVNSLDFIDKETIVIGTEKGIYFILNNEIIDSKLELSKSSREINMVRYVDGNVCFGTNSGFYISKYDSELGQLDHPDRFSSKDGLPGSEVNLNAVFVEGKDIWFGMEEALVKFNIIEADDLKDEIEPSIIISGLKIFLENKNLSKYSKGYDDFGLPINLELPYRFNYVTIEFKGLSFKNISELRYQYKLEGFDENWSPLVESDFATFTSLSPGKYTFKVRAVNKSGLISEVSSFSFVVLSPIWMTWWFILLEVLVLGGIIVFIFNYRTKIIKQKKDNENLMYKSKLLQLEQQSLNASMNRHFIFNSLNSIQYFINISDKISANKYLSNFAKLIRKNLDSTTNENNMVVLSDEIHRLELYLSLEIMRFSGKFEYKIEIDKDVDEEMLMVPSMMLQPFVENSIIHGILPKKEKGTIRIHVYNENEFTIFEIDDDGIGIKKSRDLKKDYNSEHDSKGMEITANRVDILKRILQKDLKIVGPEETYDKEGKITGTKVKIYLKWQ